MNIPFSKPSMSSEEMELIKRVLLTEKLEGNGPFTKQCHAWLEARFPGSKVLLTHSGTGALEMAALLTDLSPGDEVIMPSFTFSSTANAVVLRGAVPVFVDIRPDTLNIDENAIERAITPRTKALLPVHYAGVASEMEPICELARHRRLVVIEDAAQALMSTYKGRPLGSFADFTAISFHVSKNVTSGEGGALLVNRSEAFDRAEIIWEKGTNRSRFLRGQIDKYTWEDVGSSYLPSEITAALLHAQLARAGEITSARLACWGRYFEAFAELEAKECLRRPTVPAHCSHNGHIFYLVLRDGKTRDQLIGHLRQHGVPAYFHYVPLHSSPAGQRYCRPAGELPITDWAAERLLRLPIYPDLDIEVQERIIGLVQDYFRNSLV